MKLERDYILKELKQIFSEKFEIENPGPQDNLREEYEFDSIDAIELLVEIEKILGFPLSQEQKKMAMDVRTIDQICDYIQKMENAGAQNV
jgi:acyl carrier protein